MALPVAAETHRARRRLQIQQPLRVHCPACLSVRRAIHSRSNPAAPAASPSPPDRSWLALTAPPQNEIHHQAEGHNNQKPARICHPKTSQALSSPGLSQPNGPPPCSKFVRDPP